MARTSDFEKRTGFFHRNRLSFVMWVARQLGVPIDVHGSYFYKNLNKSKLQYSSAQEKVV